MIKATDIRHALVDGTWFALATLGLLGYQERFDIEPTDAQVASAVQSFEYNYDGLDERSRKPMGAK